MRTIATIATLGLAACGFSGGTAPSDGKLGDGTKVFKDAPIDDPPDGTPDAQECFGAGAFAVCDHPPPMTPKVLPGTIDTDGGSADCGPAPTTWSVTQPDSCFIYGSTITTTVAVAVSGSRPLVLVATDSIAISNLLDVSSHRGGGVKGPGANSLSCAPFAQTPNNDTNGGGGGAGASFMTLAGDGGTGDGAANTQQGKAAQPDLTPPTVLRSGCGGQPGGNGDDNSGKPGDGGGAVYLVAANAITISGTIDASGAGGSGGGHHSGGSGAGSGGTIALSAPTISIQTSGILMVNGGGAASGGAGGNGGDGADPSPATPLTAAAGAPSASQGGTGGNGFAGTTDATTGNNGSSGKAGGGGGGGAGAILSSMTLTGGTISGAVSTLP